MARLNDLLEEKDRLRQLEGWRVRSSLFSLRRSLGVFEGNSRELQGFLGRHGDTKGTLEALELLEFTNPAGFETFLDETDRLLHNYLAAAESLKDHADEIQKAHLVDVPDYAEYLARKRAAFDSPIGSFVGELRNHVLHERIPETDGFAVWSKDPAKVISGIALKRSGLRAAREWSKKANAYMEGAGEDILIHEIVAGYGDMVVGFYGWFDEAIQRRNRQALEDLDSRAAEVAEAWRLAWGPAISD